MAQPPSSARPVVLITGAATGIGAACAREFARQGWDLGLAYFEPTAPELAAVVRDCETLGARVLALPLDVRDDAQCRAVAAQLQAHFGGLRALVNSAGSTRFVPHADLDALDAADFEHTHAVNLVGPWQVTRACRDLLAESGQGAVVHISSVGGLLGRGSSLAYAASKGALNTLTLGLARALAPAIRVNAIAPGFVDGGLPSRVLDATQHEAVLARQQQASVLGRVSRADEVAALAWFVAARAPGMTGSVLLMDNGLHLNAG
ncbi:SDR family NAD(P)-dependent oxidoreductase [Curvibacter sp. HBC28]|uniref:SDR family NAD(P)-dependent oxidoreductase n=1 Tax=Curvibacter microcysteis TaxID=3026419 RepID=A0ABT5MFG7_9BURK|nr:SDR family oxidoreductase [Curvibacter sp. HBC28]MDD0813826.1 SDR family NAD(P)-dependent oxidoreductase [Curvibacter sp. HBC28]